MVETSSHSSSPESVSIQRLPSWNSSSKSSAEHQLDVLLAAPLGRLAPVERLLGEAAVELAELRIGLPGREAEPPAGPRHARELGRDVRVILGVDRARSRRRARRSSRRRRAGARRCRRRRGRRGPPPRPRRRALGDRGGAVDRGHVRARLRSPQSARAGAGLEHRASARPARGSRRSSRSSWTGLDHAGQAIVGGLVPGLPHRAGSILRPMGDLFEEARAGGWTRSRRSRGGCGRRRSTSSSARST